jgi:hypothetical protein
MNMHVRLVTNMYSPDSIARHIHAHARITTMRNELFAMFASSHTLGVLRLRAAAKALATNLADDYQHYASS